VHGSNVRVTNAGFDLDKFIVGYPRLGGDDYNPARAFSELRK